MAEIDETRNFIRFLTTFLTSLRRTIETPFEAQLRQKNASADLLREILRDVESARLSIAPIRMHSLKEAHIAAAPYLAGLSNELTRLSANSDYSPILKSLRFRMLPDPIPRERERESGPRFGEGFNAYDAIQSVIGMIFGFANPPGTGTNQRELFELRSIVPAQKIAPAQFEIKNEHLIVRKNRSASREEDQENIQSAKSAL